MYRRDRDLTAHLLHRVLLLLAEPLHAGTEQLTAVRGDKEERRDRIDDGYPREEDRQPDAWKCFGLKAETRVGQM